MSCTAGCSLRGRFPKKLLVVTRRQMKYSSLSRSVLTAPNYEARSFEESQNLQASLASHKKRPSLQIGISALAGTKSYSAPSSRGGQRRSMTSDGGGGAAFPRYPFAPTDTDWTRGKFAFARDSKPTQSDSEVVDADATPSKRGRQRRSLRADGTPFPSYPPSKHAKVHLSSEDGSSASSKQPTNPTNSISPFPSYSRPYEINSEGVIIPSTNLNFSRISNLIKSDKGVAGDISLWYVVATAALLGFRKASAVGELWKHISDHCKDDEEQMVAIARRVREACLKSSVLVGFPHGINALLSLHSSIKLHSPNIAPILSTDTSLRAHLSPAEKYDRGHRFFSWIYAKHTDRVLESMESSSGGDLDYYAIASVYGELMAETSILRPAETVILEFVCCLVGDVAPQAKGHFFGCVNVGATRTQMRGTMSVIRELAKQLKLDPMPGEGPGYRFLERLGSW